MNVFQQSVRGSVILRHLFFSLLIGLLLVLEGLTPVRSETTQPADSRSSSASPREARLADQAEIQFKTNKVLVTNRAYRQIFEPYLNPEGPIFITSDALLTAYHTLMEASFCRSIIFSAVIIAKASLSVNITGGIR